MGTRRSLVRHVIERFDRLMATGESRHEAKRATRQTAREAGESAAWSVSDRRIHAFRTRKGYQAITLRLLHWGDVDMEAAALQVRGTLQRTKGALTVTEPKTAHSRRGAALTSLAVEALRRHRVRQAQERLLLGAAWQDHGLVFCRPDGRPLDGTGMLRTDFYPLLKRAGLPQVRFHDLRHSAATLLLSQGIHPKIVSELLGHTTIRVTMDIYSHVLPDMQREAVLAMERLLTPKPAPPNDTAANE